MSDKKKTWMEMLDDREGFARVSRPRQRSSADRTPQKSGQGVGGDAASIRSDEVVKLMKLVPYGMVATVPEICQEIAFRRGLEVRSSTSEGNSLTRGVEAIVEAAGTGTELGIPYWRTLGMGGYLNDKYSGGVADQQRLLMNEGHVIIGEGVSARVGEFEKRLFRF